METASSLPTGTFGKRGTDWPAVCKEIDALRGKWGKVGVYSPSSATRIRRGEYPSVDPEKYEVATRTVDGVSYLWMRRRQRGE